MHIKYVKLTIIKHFKNHKGGYIIEKVSLCVILLFCLFFIEACKTEKKLPVQFSMTVDPGIEIAIGDVSNSPKSLNWLSTLTEQGINRYLLNKYGELMLLQVTSPNGKDFYALGDIPVTSGFIEIPIHFRSNSEDKIYIEQIMMNSERKSWTPDVSFTNSKGVLMTTQSTMFTQVTDAVRISMESGSFMFAYESPESDTNTVLGKLEQADLSSQQGAMDYYRQVTTMLPIGIDQVSVVETTPLSSKVLVVDMLSNQIEHSGKMYYGSLIIRIWIEGWDHEAYNHILGDAFSISIRFTI